MICCLGLVAFILVHFHTYIALIILYTNQAIWYVPIHMEFHTSIIIVNNIRKLCIMKSCLWSAYSEILNTNPRFWPVIRKLIFSLKPTNSFLKIMSFLILPLLILISQSDGRCFTGQLYDNLWTNATQMFNIQLAILWH